MKKNKIIIYLSLILTITLITTGCGKEIEIKNGSKVAVEMDEFKFTATEYYNEIKKENITKLIDMIDKDLLNKKYKSDKEENEAVNKQIDQIKSSYGSDANTYKNIMQQYFGVDNEKDLEEKLRLEYKRTEAVKDYIKNNIKDKEIEEYYEQSVYKDMKASHILITVDVKEDATEEEKSKAEAKAKEKAEKIIKELDEGKKFADLAKKNSKDEANASNGGDLGYFSYDEMVEEFSKATKDLNVNEYTKEPVKTEFGYHIILKTGEKDKPKLKSIKKEIKEKIQEQKLSNDPGIYYESLLEFRKENKIKWNDDALKKAYEEYMENLITNARNSSNMQ